MMLTHGLVAVALAVSCPQTKKLTKGDAVWNKSDDAAVSMGEQLCKQAGFECLISITKVDNDDNYSGECGMKK